MRLHRGNILSPTIIALLTVGACGGDGSPKCVATQQTFSLAFNTFTTSGAPVARFALQQNYTDYEPGGCNIAGLGGPISLTITSTAPVPLAFTYTLQGLGATGLVVWTYNGAVNRIAPGEVIAVGQVATSATRVDVGGRAIFTSLSQVP